jgi:hypothetical protein
MLTGAPALSQSADLSSDLIIYYPFNGGASDITGSTEGSAFGTSPSEDRFGVAGGALRFDSQDDVIQITGGGGLNARESGTVALWVKWDGQQDATYANTYGPVLARQQDWVFSNNIIALSNADPDQGQVVWTPHTASNSLLTGRSNVQDDRWRHVVVTFTPSEHRLYVDGRLEASGPPQQSSFYDAPGIPLTVGAWTGDGNGFFKGVLDDMRVYDRALSSEEVEALFALNPNAPDLTPREEVEAMVESQMRSWSQRGKFEKVEDYEARVNDETRTAARDSLMAEALAEVGEERIDWTTARNTYDPDREVFTITVEHLDPFALAVPIAEAEAFDANFRGVQYLNPVYSLGDGDSLVVEYVEVTDPASGSTYLYEQP